MESMLSNGPDDFRLLLGSFATGVTVVIARDEQGTLIGMTASAVSSVSLDPPLMSVCIGNDTKMRHVLTKHRTFSLSILSEDQETLSVQFADPIHDRFAHVPLQAHGDCMLIDGAVAHIVCQTLHTVAGGDHTIVIAEVLGGRIYPLNPLIHFRGNYSTTT